MLILWNSKYISLVTRKEQEQPKVTKSRIPAFKTVEEEAAFWDSHSSEEFADELTPVEHVKFVKAHSKKDLTVQFDIETLDSESQPLVKDTVPLLQSHPYG